MPSCEKCWEDAHAGYPYCDVAQEYERLIKERDANGHTCTPEEQAGPDAGVCPSCGRRAIHQYCHVCMACGFDPKSKEAPEEPERQTVTVDGTEYRDADGYIEWKSAGSEVWRWDQFGLHRAPFVRALLAEKQRADEAEAIGEELCAYLALLTAPGHIPTESELLQSSRALQSWIAHMARHPRRED
jgi:hypothetical protein